MYGSLDLIRDKQGLAHAQALKEIIDQALLRLQADKELPDTPPPQHRAARDHTFRTWRDLTGVAAGA